jgi:hypothetical protein
MGENMSANKKIGLVVLLVLLFSALSVWLASSNIDTYCFLFQLQILLMPFLTTRFLLDDIQVYFQKNQGAVGALIGAFTGLVPATLVVVVAITSFVADSGERVTAASKLTFGTIIFAILGGWVILMIISTFIGLISSMRRLKK